MTPFAGDSDLGGNNGVHVGTHGYWGSGAAAHVVYDGQKMMRDLGWWAHGPYDGPFGVLNPNSFKVGSVSSQYGGDSIKAMEKGMVFEFLPDGTAALDGAMCIIVQASQRQAIIKQLADRGITTVNGKPVEEFIVSKQAKQALRKALGSRWQKGAFGGIKTTPWGSETE
jgi:hypothetical protein